MTQVTSASKDDLQRICLGDLVLPDNYLCLQNSVERESGTVDGTDIDVRGTQTARFLFK